MGLGPVPAQAICSAVIPCSLAWLTSGQGGAPVMAWRGGPNSAPRTSSSLNGRLRLLHLLHHGRHQQVPISIFHLAVFVLCLAVPRAFWLPVRNPALSAQPHCAVVLGFFFPLRLRLRFRRRGGGTSALATDPTGAAAARQSTSFPSAAKK